MRDIIEWLSSVEGTSARIYDMAAERFAHDHDQGLASFLRLLADDERMHGRVIRKAEELAKKTKDFPSLIYLGEEAKKEIDGYLDLFEKRVRSKELTPEKLIEYIIAIESAEANDLFLYIVNTFRRRYKEFLPFTVQIQQHKRRIQRYVDGNPGLRGFRERTRELVSVWTDRFLVVDNREDIADALMAVIDEEGAVERAPAGEDALRRISETYYSAVFVGAGAALSAEKDLYAKAVERFPGIKKRFLFFTSPQDHERLGFLRENDLRYLNKPVQIKDIRKAVSDIISSTSTDNI